MIQKKWLALAIGAFVVTTGFTSCQPKPVTMCKLPPEDLLQDCRIAAPPKLKDYLAMSPQQQEQALAELNMANITNLESCNINKATLREWRAEMQAVLKKYESK